MTGVTRVETSRIPTGKSIARYVVEAYLVGGRSLEVYRCTDPLLERQVAVIIVNETEFDGVA